MEWWIEKRTGTYSETLQAVGLASTIRELGFDAVRITDHGAQFYIHAGHKPMNCASRISAGYPYIWERSKESHRPAIPFLDYEGEREKRDAARKRGKKGKAALDSQDTEIVAEARPEINVATILASMRKGWNGDRDLAKWIEANPEQALNWTLHRLGLNGRPVKEVPEFSNTQILNPISGKGVHAAKTEIRSAGSIPGQLVDAFSEWMKLRGLWTAMLLYRSDDDFKFFVIEPTDISVDEIESIRAELQGLNLWGGVKLDIQAALQCTRFLILRSDAVQTGSRTIKLLGRKPRAVIAGLHQTYFKSLGTAAALMNDAFLPLPDWFAINSVEDSLIYISIIDEVSAKGGCLNSLQEKNSDDGETLQQYRQWLLSGELRDLFSFHHRFALHLMQRLSRKEWARPFGAENLSTLLTKAYEEEFHLTDVIEDLGFQSVARALRNATVYALTLPNPNREVRFGIAQSWKQKMKAGPEEFAAAVAEFVQEYNWETAHRLKGKGHSVTTEELNSLVRLIHERKAELVGSLLLAYGYARAPKVETGQPEEAASQA
jgi:hypothetical protein